MNISDLYEHELNQRSQIVFIDGPPPGAAPAWPGCKYPLPLPESGSYEQATKWILTIVPPFLVVLGTIGNILTALVIVRNFRKMSSTAVYLLTLAVNDTVFLYIEPLRHFLLDGFDIDTYSVNDFGCKSLTFLANTSFHTSAWILVAVTAERVLSVICPFKVKRRCTKRNAVVVTLVIVMAISAMDSHLLYGLGNVSYGWDDSSYHWGDSSSEWGDSSYGWADPSYGWGDSSYGWGNSSVNITNGFESCFPINKEYSKFYNYPWAWIHFMVGFATPLIFIAIGNVLVIRGIIKMRMRQKWMNEEARYGRKPHGHRDRTLTIILILLSVMFFISQTPFAIFIVSYPYFVDDLNKIACTDFQTYMDGVGKLWLLEAVTFTFCCFNASINFVLYVISGSRFRKEIVSLLMCRKEI